MVKKEKKKNSIIGEIMKICIVNIYLLQKGRKFQEEKMGYFKKKILYKRSDVKILWYFNLA